MPEKAFELFKQVEKPNEIILVLLFQTCAQLRTAEALTLARKAASEMPKLAYSNLYVMNSLLDAYMKCGDVAIARSLFDASTKKVVHMYGAMMKGNWLIHSPKECVLSLSLIAGYIANGLPDEAIALFKRVEQPDDVIIILLFNACAQLKTIEARDLVKEVAARMPESSNSNGQLMTSLLDALMKCEDVASAESLFDKSTSKVVSMYAAMMKGRRDRRERNKRGIYFFSDRLHRERCAKESH